GREVVKLIDLGIAAVGMTNGSRRDRRITRSNELLGTPEYMAPEQLLGRDVDHRCDIYALGVTLFEAVTGNVPYAGTYPEVLLKVGTATAPPKCVAPDLPADLASIIETALALDPADRFQDATALGRALAQVPLAGGGSRRLLDGVHGASGRAATSDTRTSVPATPNATVPAAP